MAPGDPQEQHRLTQKWPPSTPTWCWRKDEGVTLGPSLCPHLSSLLLSYMSSSPDSNAPSLGRLYSEARSLSWEGVAQCLRMGFESQSQLCLQLAVWLHASYLTSQNVSLQIYQVGLIILTSQSHFRRPALPWYQSQIRTEKKRKYSWPLNNEFDLCGFTYMQIFFNSKYCSTKQSMIGWICECGTTDMMEP